MAVLQMQRISICALKKNRKEILEKIQAMGVMEVSQLLEEDDDFHKLDTASMRSSFEKAANAADLALSILQEYAPVKQSMFAALEGKELVGQEQYQKVIRKKEDLLKTIRRIHALDKERAEHKGNILKIENSMESLTPWLPLDMPLDYKGTAYTTMIPGTISAGLPLEEIYQIIAEHAPDVQGVDLHVISSDTDTTYLTVFCLKSDAETVENALRTKGFTRQSQLWDKKPQDAKEMMESEIEKTNVKISLVETEVRELAKYRDRIRLFADYYRIRADKYEVLGQLPQSERTFLISGYIPGRNVAQVRKQIEEKYDCIVDVEEIKEDEEAPVLLQNNGFSQNMEGVLQAFGLPGKGEVDPTAIMSFFYMFFFGMMLSDAAYGLIVSVVTGILVLKFPRMEEGMKKALRMFFFCGLSTIFWGVMFGGYFGDLVHIVGITYFDVDIVATPVWFEPLGDPMKLLVFAMLFGVIHLFTGFGIKGYICLRDKKYMDFFCDVVLWMVLLIGLLIMLIPSDIFASIAQAQIVFPPVVNAIGKYGAMIGALGIILMSGRSSKNFGLRIALGAYDLYNITGWLSDVLSYSRLLALGLATGVIASVVNQMGIMGGRSVGGVIMFIVVFIFGHTLNLGINLLGAYVHTNRLQFVEFFGKFYDGGGRAFIPFKANTKYVDVKEESLS